VHEAQELRRNWEMLFVPQANPDGNVLGKLHNVNKVNLHLDYCQEEGRLRPKSKEAGALWKRAVSYQPDLCLCVHTFIGPLLSADPPYEGLYVPDLSCFADEEARRRQQRADDHLIWYTDASPFWGRDELLKKTDQDTLVSRLASQQGTMGCVFEPNMSVGETGCKRSMLKVVRALVAGFEPYEADRNR